MEKTNIINYGYEIQIFIREQMGKCAMMSIDIYMPLETGERYKKQYQLLKELLQLAQDYSEEIKNEI